MDFGHAAKAAESFFMRMAKTGSRFAWIEQLEERALRINAGNNSLAGDFLAVRQAQRLKTAPPLVLICCTSAFVRISAPAALAASPRARENSPSPPRGNAADPIGLRISRGAEQQKRGGTRGPRTEIGAEDSARGNGGAQEFRVEETPRRSRQPPSDPNARDRDAVLAESANGAAGCKQVPEILRRRMIDSRRRDGSRCGRRPGTFPSSERRRRIRCSWRLLSQGDAKARRRFWRGHW